TPAPAASHSDGSVDVCDASNGPCTIAPGRNRMRAFKPGFTIEVGPNWTLYDDSPDVADMLLGDNLGYVEFAASVRQGIRYGQTVQIGPSAEAFVDFLAHLPNLVLTNRHSVVIDGHPGTSVDLATGAVDDSVDLFLAGNNSYGIVPGERIRIVAFDVGDSWF